MHVLKKASVADRVLERQIFGQRVGISRNLGEHRHQCFDLGGKIQHVVDYSVVKRLDTEPVARGEQALAVAYREGEHAAQFSQAGITPFTVCGEDRLGVGARTKTPALPQLLYELEIIVDFTVVADDGAV